MARPGSARHGRAWPGLEERLPHGGLFFSSITERKTSDINLMWQHLTACINLKPAQIEYELIQQEPVIRFLIVYVADARISPSRN
jgi:hypothetical protein